MLHTKRPTGQQRLWLLSSCVVLVLLVIVVCTYKLGTSPLFNQYEIVRAYQRRGNSGTALRGDGIVTILLWSSFFGDARWGLPDDSNGVPYFRDELKCPVYHCVLTNQHQFLPSVTLYDAILFHAAEPFPMLRAVPAERDARQAYVFALMEPPGETKHKLSDESYFYNLSMTYRLDSDIVWPYSHILDVETEAVVAPQLQPHWRKPPAAWNDTTIWQLWPGKQRMAAWFVSHCKTLSRRELLAEQLQAYIPVDIYGKCGPLVCERDAHACDELLDTKYKFYFAFENSLCTDYVTEKLYLALKRQIIPVVFGGADYTRFLPPRSYIDAERFESVEQLAEYLKFVAGNVDEYMRYFWWRRYYKLGYVSPFCNLCELLHSATWQQKTQSYANIEEWWLGQSCRFDAKIQF